MKHWLDGKVPATLKRPPVATLILIALSRHRHAFTGALYPSYSTLARETGASRRTVYKYMKLAMQTGDAFRVEGSGTGPGNPGHYVIAWDTEVLSGLERAVYVERGGRWFFANERAGAAEH